MSKKRTEAKVQKAVHDKLKRVAAPTCSVCCQELSTSDYGYYCSNKNCKEFDKNTFAFETQRWQTSGVGKLAKKVHQKLAGPGPFPETLTLVETDELTNFKIFGIFTHMHEPLKAACKFAKKVGGVVYTQIDVDAPRPNDVVYERGLHFVNRTGVYAVAWR